MAFPGRVASAVQSINSQLALASQVATSAVAAEELPLWKSITTSVPDGGLASVLKAARVQDPVAALILSTEEPSDANLNGGLGCEVLEDLLHLTTEPREFEDLQAILDKNAPTKGRPACLSRFRQAWAMAHKILTEQDGRDTTPPPAKPLAPVEPANLEDPLEKADEQTMINNWNAQHSFGFLPELTPAQGLLNRLGREWSPKGNWRMSLLQVRKVASVLHDNRPKPKQRLPIAGAGGAALHLELNQEEDMPLDDVMDYFWRLVTLFNAMAYAGAFPCTSADFPDRQVLMFGYEQASAYPQKALMNCLARAPPHQKLRWLENKDVLTRGTMLTHVNRQVPAGEALRLALDEHRADWQNKELSTLPGFDSRYTTCLSDDEPGGRSQGVPNRRRQGRRGQPAGPPPRSRSPAPQTGRVCSFFNRGKCSRGAQCKDAHLCWKKINGRQCRGKHSASDTAKCASFNSR